MALNHAAARAKFIYATDRLKDKYPATVKEDDLIGYVYSAIEREDETNIKLFKRYMLASTEVTVHEKTGTYRYKPPFEITSPEELIAYFQSQTDTRGIEVRLLKKGWPECDTAIDELEAQHKLIVLRNKKDKLPKYIWPDDPALNTTLDEEFVGLWSSVPLPHKDDVVRFLVASKRTPAGSVADTKAVAQPKKKTQKARASVKTTNKHMAGLLRDYSGMRPKGK